MAPEQLEARPTDARADIFAFGAIVYEMATGQQAFTGTSRASVIAAVLERDPALLTTPRTPSDGTGLQTPSARRSLPWMLNQIVARCLAKNPDDRFQTAVDLGQALRWMAETGAHVGPRTLTNMSGGWRAQRARMGRRWPHHDSRGGGGRDEVWLVRWFDKTGPIRCPVRPLCRHSTGERVIQPIVGVIRAVAGRPCAGLHRIGGAEWGCSLASVARFVGSQEGARNGECRTDILVARQSLNCVR